ncbi:MAG TPA: hypothetical protein ENN30_02085, partial [Candidatus Woesearchaeota archaeon]|nr:hypothetical protein [Candidatus Woesearchaeota archaeon]
MAKVVADGRFSEGKVIIDDESEANRIFNKGWFGKIIDQKLELGLV